MRKHIVFVLGSFTPEYTANVNCIQNVIRELKQRNYEISVVCATEKEEHLDIIDNVSVHRIKHIGYASKLNNCSSKIKKILLKASHFIKSVLLLPVYPNVTPIISRKVYRKLVEIQSQTEIDCLIGVYQPYFPISATLQFKKKFSDLPVIGYYLDVMKGANKPFGTTQAFFEKLCDITQKRDFSKLDKLFLPECSKMYYENDYFSAVKDKILYLNFPTLLKENYVGERTSSSMDVVYAGTTNSLYRNPTRAINIFVSLKEVFPSLIFHLYGASDMEKELKHIEQHSNGAFVYHGVVSKDIAEAALRQADYCVNFGNNVAGMVPSKVFELISSGKTIIHFTEGSTDSALIYMNQYPKAHIIDYSNSDQEIASKIIYVLKMEHENIEFSTIERLFYSATPGAVSDKIMAIISECGLNEHR